MVGGLPKVRRCKVGRLKESRPSIVSDLGVLIITHHPLHFHRSMSDFISFLCIYQTLDLRDGGLDYLGKGVSKVASNVNTIIDPAIVGNDPTDQTGTDNYMVQNMMKLRTSRAGSSKRIQRLADMKRLAYMNKTILAPCVLLNRPTKLVWVIIMDRVTVKIMSCSCKMADITDEGVSYHGSALEEVYGDEEFSRKGDECVTAMANRIATVFASMLEFPFVRYRAAKSLDPKTMTTFCDLIPTKLAAAVWNNLMKYKTLNHFPQIETCDLLISILK
ncbi:unnamed protein product [Lactuca virosa]|uniref:Uncharacterized protein n=1 Tax=Lactuca virosa TaxID=75947 RepID=A0AAU9P1X9_9ASTR|nr:unnamed protein product [Lactuca virosa]